MIKVVGDLHGVPANAKFVINQWPDATEKDYLIVCGDFGAEYGNYVSSGFKKAFKKFPGTVLVLRGNHDTRYRRDHTEQIETYQDYYERPMQGWEFCGIDNSIDDNLIYQKKYPNIKYIKDEGDILTIENKRFLFIPGAYSVDKYYRLQNNLPYEEQEQLSYYECVQLLNRLNIWLGQSHIDYVISHTCPLMLHPHIKDLFLDIIDQDRVDTSTEVFLDNVLETLGSDGFKHWYFGHHHDTRDIMGKFHMLYNTVQEIGE